MKKKTFIVQLFDSKKPSRMSFTQVEDANFYSNDTDASLVFIPHEDTFDFQSAKVVMYNRGDESLVERDAVVTTEDGRKVASYELPAEIISHWGDWTAQPVFINGGEIYSGSIVPFSVIRYLMHERPPRLTEIVTVTEFIQESQALVDAMAQAELDRQAQEEARETAEGKREEKYEKVKDLPEAFQNVIDETTGKDVISAPEIIAARRGKSSLGEKIDEVTTQLAQTTDKLDVEGWELNSKGRAKKGIVVFTSDDGRIEEYTHAKTLFESEGVPQTIAIVSSWVGNTNFCNKNQLLELQSLGWEIASHSRTHPNNPFMKDNTDSVFVEREFRESKKLLRDMGLNVNNYVYPGGHYAKRERMFAKKHYRAARNSDIGYHKGINYPPLNSHELKTVWLDPSSSPLKAYLEQKPKTDAIRSRINDIKAFIDIARETDGLLIISTHYRFIAGDVDFENMYREVIQYAKANTEVTTLNDALNKMGNIVEVGDFSETGERALGDTHFAVGVDGLVSGSTSITAKNKFTTESRFDDFPIGVTHTPIDTANATNAPEQKAGTLITYKTENVQPGFNYQEYKLFSDKKTYIRFVDSNRKFTSWEVVPTGVHYDNTHYYKPTTPFSEFKFGITFSVLSPGTTGVPDTRGGHMVTYKMGGINYQEYKVLPSGVLRDIYVRSVSDSGNYGTWRFYSPGTSHPEDNDFDHLTPFSRFPKGTTYSIITGTTPNLATAPDGQVGTLVTHKIKDDGSYGFNYQEYHLFSAPYSVYKRRALDKTTWDVWKKISVE